MATTTIINARAGVTPFCGRENGELKQSVECFISSLESLITTKGITDKQLIVNEARSYLDYSKGDLSFWTRTLSFRNCDDWDKLKCFLRKVYGGYSDIGLVRDMGSILRLVDRQGYGMVANGAKINDRMLEFVTKLRTSEWVTGDKIKVDDFSTLLQLGLVMASLPEPLVNCFDKPLTKDSSETDIMSQVLKHKGKIVDFDLTILEGKESLKSKKKEMAPEVNVVRNVKVGDNVMRSTGNAQVNVNCHNCGRRGHVIRDCYTKYCSFHNATTHSLKDCRSRSNAVPVNNVWKNRSPSSSRGFQNNFSYANKGNFNGRYNGYGNRPYNNHPGTFLNKDSQPGNSHENQTRGRSQTPSPNVNKGNFHSIKREMKNL